MFRELVPLLVCLGCGVSAVPRPLPPSRVQIVAALPPGYSAQGKLRASCHHVSPRAFTSEPLPSADCTEQRLSRELRARAGEQGTELLVGLSCRRRASGLDCSAAPARATSQVPLKDAGEESAPAPSPEQVLDLDEPRPQDAAQIRVSFQRVAGSQLGWARGYAEVAETAQRPVGRAPLGQVSAECESCSTDALRHALRVTAGHVGAGEVTEVKCFRGGSGPECVATAIAPWSF